MLLQAMVKRKCKRAHDGKQYTPSRRSKMEVPYDRGQVVDDNGLKLTQVLGLHARNRLYFPIYLHWKEQSKKSFEDVMNDVKKFDFVDEDDKPVDWHLVVQFCKKSIQKKILDWRGELTVYYDAVKTEEELLKNPDNAKRISQGDWEQLILFWRRLKKKEEFEQNKKNRDGKRAYHTTGSQPFAII